uniref:G_PROTEIN_RECEP_F2_4 domain-containing protein n=2 Tax=Bursaphelenchus xylophilus TaxID=6326 RepID=A0A1I7SE03_BURXY
MSRAQFTYGTVLNLLLFSLASNASEILDSSEDDGGFIQDPKIRETVSWAHKCADKSFICTYDCNVVTNATGDCVRPNATTCFNLMVDYNYTLWKSPFPHHLAGLQKFPTCWQVLEPLICGIWYRPCAAMRTFNLRRGTPKMSQYFKAYSMDYCYKVRSKCQKFVHLLPPELDCDEFAHPREEKRPDRTLYNPECELKPAFNLTLANSAPQCFHPLSLSTGINGVSPLVDQCYLPCRTDYFGHINAFYHFVVVFCTTIALCAPALPVYLLKDIRNSKLATWNYVFNMCTASICVYYTLWSIFLMLVYFKKTTVCQKDELGNYLRIDFHTIWCKSQRIALQFVLTSIISWSFVLSYCLLIDRNFKKASNSTKGILTMVVYLLSVTLVVISMIWDVYYADPYYGVCHPGMDPFLSGLFLYVPAVVTSIFLLVTYVLGRRSGPVRPESSKPMVGVNLGGIRINLSFPGLATNLMVFVIGAISHFSPSKSTHDEIVMVKRSVSCFTSRSEGLVGLIQEG